jgi:hypothetical protein
MSIIRAPALATCSFLILGTAATAATVNDVPSQTGAFLDYCKTNSEGCLNEIADMSFAMLVTDTKAKKEWCPTKETDDVKVLTPKVVGWLTAHPEVSNKTTDDGIKAALIQLYPCKR